MRIANDKQGPIVTTRRRNVRRVLLATVLTVVGLSASSATAGAVTVKAPAWKLLGAVGPTHLSPTQSEVQRVSVGAEGGTFVLSRKAGEGSAVTVSQAGNLTFAAEATTAKIESVTAGASFSVGLHLAGLGIVPGTEVLACSPDCTSKGSLLTLSKATTSEGKNRKINILLKELKSVVGIFHVGDELSGESLEAGTVVTSVGVGTLGISTSPTGGNTILGMVFAATENTVPIADNAPAETVQSYLEALPTMGPGSVSVTGGPGGSAENPYFIAYGGPFSEQNVAELAANGSSLVGEGAYVHVFTTVPGGAGTGEIRVFPTNVGGGASTGTITVKVGPLPAGIVTSGKAGEYNKLGVLENHVWNCPGGAGEEQVECTTTTPVSALSWTRPITVPVEVRSATGLESSVSMSISETGGGSASYQIPVVVSALPAEGGFQSFWSGEFEANGEPTTQAGGHPFSQLTAFELNTDRSGSGQIVPAGDIRDVTVGLPVGLVGDPLGTERCPQSALACGVPGTHLGLFTGDTHAETFEIFKVSNDIPPFGSAAEFNAAAAAAQTTLNAAVRSEEDFGIDILGLNSATTWLKTYGVLTVFEGEPVGTPGAAFFANPTDCAQERAESEEGHPPAITIKTNTWQHRNAFSGMSSDQPVMTGCDHLHFGPEFSFQPSSVQGSSPVGATAHLHIDQSGLADSSKLATPALKTSVVTLPAGFSVNPSQATGLQACSEAQVGYLGVGGSINPTRFDNAPVSCPDASKLGTAEVTVPLLEEKLEGTLYLAAQDENPFHSMIALYLVIESPRFGITLKMPGKVETDPNTGQVTAIFDHVPQQPVEDLTLKFRGGGGRSEFSTPDVCGTYTTKGTWTPWSAPESGPPAETEDGFTVSTGCSSSAAARPFSPSFEAGTVTPVAGAYSPLVIKLGRNDGEQELSRFEVTLPEGLLGKLAGVTRCSDAAIAAASATGRTGREEQASPSCPAASLLGSLDTLAGVGSEPLHVSGNVYLAGAYEGAPLSVVTVTPAVAGPFDLGSVVVRAPLFIDKTTSQVTAKSDAIPTILKGIPLKVRSVSIDIDRPSFALNPTSCEAMSATGAATGSSGATHAFSNRFQVGECSKLSFKPGFTASTQAKTSRANGASLSVSVTSSPGQANIHSVHVALPKALPSRLTTLQKACTAQVFDSNPAACPSDSIVGHAKAVTPILGVPLEGPAYFVSHGGAKFPELIIVLQAEGIRLDLDGETFIKNGITSSTFHAVPDAPVTTFELTLPEGPGSALAAPGGDLCSKTLTMPTLIQAQNGARIEQNTPIRTTGCPYTLNILAKTVKNTTATIKVSVPQAGKLTTTANGLTSAGKTTTGRQTVTLKLKEHSAGPLHTSVLLRFTPSTGKQRKILRKTLHITFH